MNPFLIPGIAQEVEALQKRQQDLLKSQSEVDAATSAYRDYLASQQNQPQFQMPQVQPNKTAAGIGAVLALIGALTGDKRAVPAFGQFAGGLQQNTEAQRQRLLQEQQLKMQNQAQKDKAIGQLLGFDLENAQAKYSQESKSQQMLREQRQKSADAVKDRQFELEKLGIQNASKQAVAKTAAEASIERAKIQAVPKAEALYTSMLKSGVPEPQARDIAYQMTFYAAKTDKLKSGAEYDRLRPLLTREQMTAAQKRAETLAQSGERRTQMQQEGAMSRTVLTESGKDRRLVDKPKTAQKGASEMYPEYKGLVTEYQKSLTEFNTKKAAYDKSVWDQQNRALAGEGWQPSALDLALAKKAEDEFYAIKQKRDRLAKEILKREAAYTRTIKESTTNRNGPMNPFAVGSGYRPSMSGPIK